MFVRIADNAEVYLHVRFFLLDNNWFEFCSYLVDVMKEGTTVILRNAKIEMFKGSMRLNVDKWGRVEETEPASFTVKEDSNLSLIEFELVNVVVD